MTFLSLSPPQVTLFSSDGLSRVSSNHPEMFWHSQAVLCALFEENLHSPPLKLVFCINTSLSLKQELCVSCVFVPCATQSMTVLRPYILKNVVL
jgi:hypothetical protein